MIIQTPSYLSPNEGLTSTTANHLCNIAKELMETDKARLENLSFLDTTISLLSGQKTMHYKYGIGSKELEKLTASLSEMSELKAFIAYFRQCIREKEKLIDKLNDILPQEYAELLNITEPKEPEREEALTLEEHLNSLSLDDFQAYYSLEARVATLGKILHPNGDLAKARKQLNQSLNKPIEVQGEGSEMIIYESKPSLTTEEIESLFFQLQSEYRDRQARLNHLSSEYKRVVEEENKARDIRYAQAMRSYQEAITAFDHQYHLDIEEERRRISALRILIPQRLKATFDRLRAVGKDGVTE